MKYLLLLIIIVFNCTFCFGQKGKFQLFVKKSCSVNEQLDTNYYLMSVNSLDTIYSPQKGIVHLPFGKYFIDRNIGVAVEFSVIEIVDTSLLVKHYTEPKISVGSTGVIDSPPAYFTCDSVINGYAEDYHPNGKIKIRGNFKNGYPKDSLVTFYTTGIAQKREIREPKVVHVIEYDSLGRVTKISHRENKHFMVYGEYNWTEFYPNSTIKSTESSVKRVLTRKEFYPAGKLKVKIDKKSKAEFYENGNKSVVYQWRKKKDEGLDKIYRIKKSEYNIHGVLVQETLFEWWNDAYSPPELEIDKLDWVVKATKYKNGKAILVVKDIDTKDYVEKFLKKIH